MPRTQLILCRIVDEDDPQGNRSPTLGSPDEVLGLLSDFNTGPESPEAIEKARMSTGVLTLHGPGFRVEAPMMSDPIPQMIVTLTDADYGFTVLHRLCRATGWKLLDPDTGRTFG